MKIVHHDLKVWQESMELSKMIYEFSYNFPIEETCGLKIQRAFLSRLKKFLASSVA